MKTRLLLALCALVVLTAPVRGDDEKIDQDRAKKALKDAEKIEKQVEKLRELRYQVPVRKGVESKADLRAMISSELSKPETKAEFDRDSKVGKAFGLLPRDFDLEKETGALLVAGIAGHYDLDKKKFFLIVHEKGWLGLPEEQADEQDGLTMAHELEHALQDQNFDLQRWSVLLEDHVDRVTAWKFVYEGEAQFVAYSWQAARKGEKLENLKRKIAAERAQLEALKPMLRNKDLRDQIPAEMKDAIEQFDLMERLPPYVVQNLMLPYEDGAIFVQRVHEKGGWDAVTKLFLDPPSSTQQILHPEKFFDRVEPAEISMPSLAKVAGPKAKDIQSSTLGELNVRLLLETFGGKKKLARTVAAGWHGDRYQAIEVDGKVVLAWLTIWESEAAAQAFEEVYRGGVEKLHGGKDGFSLVRHGASVLLVDGGDAALRAKLEPRAWASAVDEGHLRALPGLVEKPPLKDFTEVPGEAVAASSILLGDRVNDEDIGISIRLPSAWKRQDKDPLPAEIQAFSRGLWKSEAGAELRLLDLPMPFDKESLLERFETTVKKQIKEYKKTKDGERSVGGHEALWVEFEGILPDGNAAKRQLRAVAVERDEMTLLLLLAAPDGKLAGESAGLEAALATLEIVPSKLKGEVQVSSDGKEVALSVGGEWKQATAKAPALLRVEKEGASIQVVSTRATSQDLDTDARGYEETRSSKLDGYRSLGLSTIERAELGKAYISDYEFKTQDGSARRVRELVTLKDGKRWAVTCACAPDAFEKNRPVFARALATFALGGKKEPSKPEKHGGKAEKPEKPEKPEKKQGGDEPF